MASSARRLLLQEASRLYQFSAAGNVGIRSRLASLASLQGLPAAWPPTLLLRQLSTATRQAAQESNETAGASSPAEQQGGQGGSMRGGRPQGWRQAAAAGDGSAQQGRPRRRLYIPRSWEQQARNDFSSPLVQEMQRHVDANEAWEARQAFEAVLGPLEEGLQRGEAPAAGQLPPPYAWKLYFAVLAATGCHPHRMSSILDLMHRLGANPQSACYVIALRQMAVLGVGSPAFSTIIRMKALGLAPTLHCYTYAIESCMRAHPPDFNYCKRLFDEIAEQGLAQHPSQKAELGKLIMHAAREFAQHKRFGNALGVLDQLEGLGLRVPPLLVADIMQLAAQAGHTECLLGCVKRLEQATSTFQEVPGVGDPVTRPLKVEEGLLLQALEVAANKGDVELAEAAWKVMERSLALPNPPSSGSALNLHLRKAAELQQQQQGQEQQQGGQPPHAVPAGHAELEQLSAELEEAAEAVAAEAPAAAARNVGATTTPKWLEEEAAASAAAMSAVPRGMRKPTVLSYLAYVHAYAKAGQLPGLFEAVRKLEEAYPEDTAAASYHGGLPMAVDLLAESDATCDDAFFLLEGWSKEGRNVSPSQLNLVVAACCQIGDLKRAFETFDSYGALGVQPNADTYNALMQGCVESGHVDTAFEVYQRMQEAGVEPNAHTHQQLVDACVVSGDVAGMMGALEAMELAGHSPKLALLERCVARAERAGARQEVRGLLRRLFRNDYRIVGIDAKCRRWAPEGGMPMLTGSSQWFSREEELREMRRESRELRERKQQQHQQQEHAEQEAAAEA